MNLWVYSYSSELKSSNKQHEIHDNDDTNFNDLANDDDKEIQGPEDNLELDDDFEISNLKILMMKMNINIKMTININQMKTKMIL